MTDRLGRYRIVRLLARGGVAEVYLARVDGPGGFSRPVAVKRLKPAYRFEPSHRRQLIAEARVGALLDHPNILHYLELVEDGRELFIVTEYLHGVSTRALIQTAATQGEFLPVSVALHIVACLLDALDFAHDAVDDRGSPMRLVHRDISPENLFLAVSGAVKLIDFGIAETPLAPRDTQMHVVKGKARYFSPEQARGAPLSAASDLYSVGLMLFELLTGTPAIHGEDERDVLQRAQSGRVASAHEMRPELPGFVLALLERALSFDVARRFPSAAHFLHEVRHALARVAPEHGPTELRRSLARFFAEDLETRRRAIWNDQSTAIVDADEVARRSSPGVPAVSAPPRPAERTPERPRYAPEASAPASPAPPQPTPADEPNPAARAQAHAAHAPAAQAAAPAAAGEPSDLDTLSEMDVAEAPVEPPRPGALNLSRLRRAVSEAYTPSATGPSSSSDE